MNVPPLLRAGIGTLTGAVLATASDGWLVAAAAAAAVYCIARFRAPGALALALGFASASAHANFQPRVHEHTARFACTFLQSDACVDDSGTVFGIALDQPPAPATRVELRGRIEPFDAPRNPGEPDMRDIERERGVQLHVSGAHVLRVLPEARMTFAIAIARAHAWALERIHGTLDEPYASILAGELWGERSALPPQLHAEFQETGTVHILVTAGLHLGAVVALVLWLLRAVRAPRWCLAALGILAAWGYAAFSGLHTPSVRAASMISFGLAAYAYGAAPLSWNAYGAALCLFVLGRPQSISSASFALSFSCVGGILLLARRIGSVLENVALPARVREALTLAVATQIASWPLTASIFMIAAPYAVLANLLVVPVVAMTMIAAMVQVAAYGTMLGTLASTTNGLLLQWITGCITSVASLPFAYMPVNAPPAFAVIVYDAAIVAAVALCSGRGRTLGAALIALATCVLLEPPPSGDTRLRITILDVGQADAIVIQTPLGHTLLVDAGGRLERGAIHGESLAENVGERIVVPFLRRNGVRTIDAIILSHPHGDHAGGIAPVLRNYSAAGELADSGQKYGGYAYNDALTVARAEHVPVMLPRAGDVWRLDDGVTLTFIGPSLPFITSNNAINDNSVAFILQYKHFRMLFTGDAGVAAEQRFLSEGIDLHVDVIKVGHHGSAYSSGVSFIAAVRPRYAIISVGRHNMFGHPAASTIETLQRFCARVYRTDADGAVTVVTAGSDAAISTMSP